MTDLARCVERLGKLYPNSAPLIAETLGIRIEAAERLLEDWLTLPPEKRETAWYPCINCGGGQIAYMGGWCIACANDKTERELAGLANTRT